MQTCIIIVFNLAICTDCLRLTSIQTPAEEIIKSEDEITELGKMGVNSMTKFITQNNSLKDEDRYVVFFAGVEGSGHHVLETMMKKIKHHTVDFPKGWGCGEIWKHDEIHAMVNTFQSLTPGQIHILPQQASYPECGVPNHKQRRDAHPRLEWIAEAAKEAGVKFHVIQLYRAFDDCLAADCLHRKFETCPLQAETLNANGATLVAQLNMVPKDMISCFHYGDHQSMQKALEVTFGAENIPQEMVDVIFQDHVPKGERNKVSNWATYIQTFSETDATLMNFCLSHKSVLSFD